MPFLTPEHAQQIVDKMRPTIPYNINIMNEKGVIIASSNRSRIGQIHDGAVEAMRQNEVTAVYENSGDMKIGVNMPITFQEAIVGVIGISGDVEKTSSLIQLVKITVELLINQEYLTNTHRIKQRLMEQFLYEWAYRTSKYSPVFINRGLSLGIDVQLPRKSVVLFCASECDLKDGFDFLGKNDFFLRIKPNEYVLFLTYPKNFEKKISSLLNLQPGSQIGIGGEQNNMCLSVRQAENACQIGALVQPPERVYRFEDIEPYALVLQNAEESLTAISNIEKLIAFNNNSDLLETLVAFIQNDGEINRVSQYLHIHRNSLNYRLERIAEITGKNPKKYTDMFLLYMGYIAYRFREIHRSTPQ